MESKLMKPLAVILIILAFAIEVVILLTGGNNETAGWLLNLGYAGARWLENPWWAAIVITILVNIFGYVENLTVETGQAYVVEKFVETWMFYEPTLIILSQTFPMPYAAVIALIIDIARRAITRLKPTVTNLLTLVPKNEAAST